MCDISFKIQKIRDVKTPTRAYSTDAGIDFFIPNILNETDIKFSKATSPTVDYPAVIDGSSGAETHETTTTISIDQSIKHNSFLTCNENREIDSINIAPHSAVLIPSGIKGAVPTGYALVFFNKSGVATKKQLIVGACVVDAGYRNEVHIHLINTSNEFCCVCPGDKIVQGLLIPISICKPEIVDDIDLLGPATERGLGGFGSTGTR